MRRLLVAAAVCLACARTQAPGPAGAPVINGPAAVVETIVRPERIRIVGTNDFHGALEARPDAAGHLRGGAGAFAGAIEAARAECRPPVCLSLLLDGGDQFQGTPASNLAHGRPVIEVFNHLGLAASALGNHEFDWTQDTLRVLMATARYHMMGANIRYADGRDVPWIPDDTIIHLGPVSVGVIGISTQETPQTTMPANVADLRFVDPVPVIDSLAPLLRSRGADIVVVVGHIGGMCTATACEGEAINVARRLSSHVDLIVGGHSHSRIDTEIRGLPVVEARSRGQAIDVVDIPLARGAPVHHEVREVFTDSIVADAAVQTMVQQAVARITPIIDRPIATIAAAMPVPVVGALIADAMRVVGQGDIGLMNRGGVRQALPAGVATYGTLFEVQPFANTFVRTRVKGADLRTFFANALSRGTANFLLSGARIVFRGPPNPGIDTLLVGGKPIVDDRIYSVIQSNFTSTGGDGLGFGAAAISTEALGMTDLDGLIIYLRGLPQPISPPTDERLVRRP